MDPGAQGALSVVQTYPAVPRSVPAVRRLVDQFAKEAGASASTADAIALAASEATTNVVVHAYRDRSQPGDFDVLCTRMDPHLVITIRDSGQGLLPRADSPGLGLGFAVIARQADRLDLLESPAGGLELRMYFSCAPA